jgi:tetratricopeptide (TPR) repeat protein
MRKTVLLAVVVAFVLGVPFFGFAQDASSGAAAAATDDAATTAPTYTAETDHYRVISEVSQAQAEDVAQRMEAALDLYNGIFHFDLAKLTTKFRVKVFEDVDSFNTYLTKVLSQTRTDFVFVAWSDPERSELLCFPKEDKAFTASLLHQGCIQFIKGFVENPPIWLREGVATYLDNAAWDPASGTFTAKPNLAWLDSLKAIIRGQTPNSLISFADLLTITREKAQSSMDVFAPESWGLVHFLLNAPQREYSRVLWDSVTALSPGAGLDENSQAARRRGFSWFTDQQVQKDFQAYVIGLKTSSDLLKDAIDAYARADLSAADDALTQCVALEPGSSTAWYYKGLVAYARKDYTTAEEDYLKAFQLGASAGVINYALGVNSFAAGRNTDATKYLTFAKQADKTAYGDKVDTLLKRMDTGK